LREVDAWAADQALTCDDNMAHVLSPGGLQLDRIRLETAGSPPPPFLGLPPMGTRDRQRARACVPRRPRLVITVESRQLGAGMTTLFAYSGVLRGAQE